ncbi:MAG: SusC/RagA family TonB-linked outer membrane protein [Pseudopedobacter saltans]|uniref:SusC/RagA family TonB-linked outer membrane protein n=1 Tax=Pseudopedobacter saltans TaxID=151895 RepID=A0A2W5H148_9SPHI|nr:MAG: SusC/RagA family TonB-linked outer membrane protein [Pseudopedobacter saltans]
MDPALKYTTDFADVNFQNQSKSGISVGETVDIAMKPKEGDLDEVVVVGYGTMKKKDLTSAIVDVTPKDFNAGGARNAMDLIQGKVAGLNITRTSGSNPNSGVSMQLRGVASINGSNSPLVVIDGVPGGNLDLLQQSDIESISVLKDGSAAAIYGTRANGGVILVTTKKAKSGAPIYDYNGWVRKEYLYRYPKVLSAAQYRQRMSENWPNSKMQDFGSSTDWFDELVNHSNLSHYHNVSMSGGTANTSYRASVYFSNMEGIAKANSRQQYGATMAIHNKGFNNRLTTDINILYNNNEANLLGGGNWEDALFNLNPTQSPYDSSNLGGYWNQRGTTNVVSRLNQETSTRSQQTTLAQLKSTLQILNDLTATVSGSVQRDQYVDNQYRSIYSQSSQNDGDVPNGGYAYKSTWLGKDFLFEPTINYNSSFSKDHSVTAVVGYSYQNHVEEGFNASNKGFTNDLFQNDNLSAGTALGLGKAGMGSSKYSNKLIAFFGRANYSYRGKYLAQFILRHEGSTFFGDNNKWANFPGVSAGWVISQENFMKSISWVNNLKLRVGYGITGNQGFPNGTSYLALMGTGGFYQFPNGTWQQTYGPRQNYNPDLRWERKKEWNLGLDFSLFNYAITGSIDYFHRRTSNLALNNPVEVPSNVATTTFMNIGTLGSNGIELALGATPVKGKDFQWSIDATASHTTNKLLTYTNAQYMEGGGIPNPGNLGNSQRNYPGQLIGAFYGKRFAGFTDEGKWLFYNKEGAAVPVNQITPDDYTFLGNGQPRYFASLTNTFRYKDFSLRFFLRGKFGYDILNLTDMYYGNRVATYNMLQTAFTTYKDLNDNMQYSNYYIQSGNYVKLDEVTFSYNIRVPKNNYIRNVSVYVTGTNLWLITKYKNNDPDFVNDTGLFPGVDSRGVYPSTRSFLIGAHIGF